LKTPKVPERVENCPTFVRPKKGKTEAGRTPGKKTVRPVLQRGQLGEGGKRGGERGLRTGNVKGKRKRTGERGKENRPPGKTRTRGCTKPEILKGQTDTEKIPYFFFLKRVKHGGEGTGFAD